MSDNRTTELLREGLTERGIEWKNVGGTTSGDGITEWLVDGMTCRAAQRVTVGIEHLALYIPVLTPEQAIAATLGEKPRDRTEEWLLKACNRATQDYVTQLEQEVDELKGKLEAATLGEPIIRCRDCRHMHTVRHWPGVNVNECWLHADRESGALGKERTEPDGFCMWAERKEVD